MKRAEYTPSTGYYVNIEICDATAGTDKEIVQRLRAEVKPLGLHVTVLEASDEYTEYPYVRISTGSSPTALRKWLDDNGFGHVEVINARTRNPQFLR